MSDIYNNLHESLQVHVHKMDMTHNVLPSLPSKASNVKMCENCCFHGFPCLNCAYYKFNGTLGPGCLCGDKVMYSNELDPEDEEANFNMLLHILMNGGYNVRICDSINTHHLPQYDCYCSMHT